MPTALRFALGITVLLALVGFAIWFVVWRVKKSEDPTRVLIKLVATAIIVGLCGTLLLNEVGFSLGGAFIVPFVAVFLGIVGSIMWAPHIGAALAKPITAMFDGGNEEVIPQPLYSIAIAKRKLGRYDEAIAHVQGQLAKFPNDATGQIMLAEIQADDLHDMQAAELTIQRFCNQPGHAPESLAIALTMLADWHMKHAHDLEAARQALEKIIDMLPDSEQAQTAHQRLAKLGRPEDIAEAADRSVIPVPLGVQNIGLMKDSSILRKPEEDPAKTAARYVEHLNQFPLDAEIREKLAVLYAEHYQRFDLALFQLEELINTPNQPAKQVVHWLNLAADIQIKAGAEYEAVRATLERIIDLYPARSYAENARQRLERLKLELKARETTQSLQLGVYDQRLGLKHGPPKLGGG